ncbi:hypothetical protein PABY_10010 [Pyrodictium abyssi]|uniref:Uncharacterized protein n=1 Tax=Pyrodictium abyssi TaxID=54256 RepID=A0ABM8IV62_9CREN|nr:hypothetical protein PABY_10010 [Pyrodictium abyssi]
MYGALPKAYKASPVRAVRKSEKLGDEGPSLESPSLCGESAWELLEESSGGDSNGGC